MNARKSLLTKALLSAGAFAVLAGSAGTAVASAATHPAPTTAVTKITSRYDSGGNGNWATDNFTRTLALTYLGKSKDPAHATAPYMYSATLTDSNGSFKDIPFAYTPNQGGRDLGKVLKPTQVGGPMSGFGDFGLFYSSAKANNPHVFANEGVPVRLRGVTQNGEYPSSTWPELAFPAGTTFNGLNESWWGYTYQVPATTHTVVINGVKHVIKTKAENWADTAWNGDGQLAPADGNITG